MAFSKLQNSNSSIGSERDEYECCIPQNKLGVPMAATNTAGNKCRTGCYKRPIKFHNVTAPIFVDRAESVALYCATAQLIQLIVIKGEINSYKQVKIIIMTANLKATTNMESNKHQVKLQLLKKREESRLCRI